MILLASASPRRRGLLELLGVQFEVRPSHIAEFWDDGVLPDDLAMMNARAKATAVGKNHPGNTILSADTVVALGRRTYGKPLDEEQAKEILHFLSGKTHTVVTAMVLITPEKKTFSEIVTTEVTFAPLSDDEIDAYVATGEPMDKAGAYAIQGRAAAFVSHINGSYTNVVGLPLQQFIALAKKAGVDLYGSYAS